MATQTIVTRTDDLDPTLEADESIDFALDGKDFEIDLNAEHASWLRDALAPFIAAARKAGGNPHKPSKPGQRSDDGETRKLSRDELAHIRTWVRENGGEIKDRGRLPQRIIDAYRAGDTSVLKRDAEPEAASAPASAGVGAGGDPFATF